MTVGPPSQSSDEPGMDCQTMAALGADTWNCWINGDHACGTWESRESQTLANRGTWELFNAVFIHVYSPANNYFAYVSLTSINSFYSTLLHFTPFYFVLRTSYL